LHARAREHPLVQAVLAAFPGAEISEVRPPGVPGAEAEPAAATEDDDWDPFDPFAEEI
jgi:DNA polymerase III subunit gamma/tau